MKRLFDILFAVIGLVIFALPILIIGVLVRLTSKGSALYWSDRVGREKTIFRMPKFRTMRLTFRPNRG